MDQTRDIRLVKEPVSDSPPYYSQSWALVIGIDRYHDASARLANARNDAAAVADVLANVYSFEHVYTLYDEEATKDTILSWLRDKLPAQAQPNDRVVIFFAGHGTTREGVSGQKRGYLIPYEAEFGRFADYVDMSELRDACGWIPAKHILIILDCCFSGIAAVTARITPPSTARNKLTENYIRRITERGAWQVLTAGAQDELVADSGSRPGHSAFTSALLAGLHGEADHNQDSVITASDLANFIKPEVSRETTASGGKGQIPFFSYFAGSDQGDFVLIKPGDTPRLAPPPMSEQVTMAANRFWLWGALAAAIVVLALMGWFAWSSARETQRVRSQLTALVGTLTQEAIAYEVQQEVTLAAITDAPQSTKQVVFATQTAAIIGTRTALPSRVGAISGDLPVLMEPTATPTPSATSRSIQAQQPEQAVQPARPTSTRTPPGAALQQAPLAQTISTPAPQNNLARALTNPKDCGVYVHVAASNFEMGPDESAHSQIALESDTVFVDDFWIGRTEVTNAQYARCLEEGGCSSLASDMVNDVTYADYPVTYVTWQHANEYARWAGGRLPTEAEWEKAACGTEEIRYPWGNQPADDTLLNFSGVTISDGPVTVGSYPKGASPYGLLDMAGNVQEWTGSLFQPYPYQADDGREDPDAEGERVTRGGAYFYDEYDARCATRVGVEPSYQDAEVGFRVVITDPSILVSNQCEE